MAGICRLFGSFSSGLVLKVEITLPVCILAKLFLEPREGLNKKASLTVVRNAFEKSQKCKLWMLPCGFEYPIQFHSWQCTPLVGHCNQLHNVEIQFTP